MHLSEIGEFGLIKKLRSRCADVRPEIITGIGDDAAVIRTGKKNILVTSDMLLEGIHFDLSFATFQELGQKFLAVNVSDIYAMGGRPQYFFASLGIPQHCTANDIKELYSGILKAAKKYGVAIAGGDTCASDKGLVLSGTLIGHGGAKIIKRSGAREGDGIFVTKTLGDSAMGLMLLKKIKKHTGKCKNKTVKVSGKTFICREVLALIKRHLMPVPSPLKNISGVTAMIDISDGLLMDLWHVCDESRVGAVIYRDKIPVSRELLHAAGSLGLDPEEFAFKGGEDYALLFTAPIKLKTNATLIGEITKKGRFIADENGGKTSFKPEGYEHFRKGSKGPRIRGGK